MNSLLCRSTALVASLVSLTAFSAVYSGSPFAVPDGNVNGAWSQIQVTGALPVLTELRLALTLEGGYNGDLYAYLSYRGHLVPLLNRIGVSAGNVFGFNGNGMEVVFSDTAETNVHAAGNGYLSGVFRSDGQLINPLLDAASFSAGGGSLTLDGTFAGLNPNGLWTLFVSDVVLGSGSVAMRDWSLEIAAIPEPGIGELLLIAGFLTLTGRRAKLAVPWR